MRRFILLLSLLLPSAVFAQEATVTAVPAAEVAAAPASADPYTVSDVEVDVTAANAVDARAQAFAKGPGMALQKWAAAQTPAVDVSNAKSDRLVRDFQVNEEHFSRTRYTAKLTYRFKPQAMAHLANPNVPEDVPQPTALDGAVPPEVPVPVDPTTPVDYDQPWSPTKAPGMVSQPPAPDTAVGLSTWRLLVRFDQVAQWLQAQDFITARPEVRGLKLISMGQNQAEVSITSAEPIGAILARWGSMGWAVGSSDNDTLTLDATHMGH